MKFFLQIAEVAEPGGNVSMALIILFLPFFSFAFLYFFGRYFTGKGDWLATGTIGISFLMSLALFVSVFSRKPELTEYSWFVIPSSKGDIPFTISIFLNDATVVMLIVVTLVSFLVHLYSMEYMIGKRNYLRYFPYLGLFTFSMTGIVLSHNLLVTFMFWELVGFSSYLLIGFWFEKDAAQKASRKAFLYNRLADLGFIAGLLVVYAHFETFDLFIIEEQVKADDLLAQAPFWMSMAGIGIFCGCLGKSAQFPFHVWLPDAMEGPTPVSALIHAATMVAAGVYLLYKVFFMLTPQVLDVIAIIGAVTAFIGAFCAIAQNDIKKLLAYSTISQLGFMTLAIGTGAWYAALFHLVTHAFFKACLFLSAGAVIHSMHHVHHDLFKKGHYINFDVLDMRLMGGFRKKMPITFITYLLSASALIGLPFFSGFLSKDAILAEVFGWAEEKGDWAWIVPALALVTILFTAFYMSRQIFMIFFSRFRLARIHPEADVSVRKVKDIPGLMRGPQIVLAFLSLWFVFSFHPFHPEAGWLFSRLNPGPSVHIPGLLAVLPVILSVSGILMAWVLYGGKGLEQYSWRNNIFQFFIPFKKLAENGFYLDKLYNAILIKPAFYLGEGGAKIDARVVDGIIHAFAITNVILAHTFSWVDRNVVDGFIHLLVNISGKTGKIFLSFQSGKIQGYLLMLVITFVLLLLFLFI